MSGHWWIRPKRSSPRKEEPLVKEINATAYPALFVALYGDISEPELIRNPKLSDEIQKLNTVLEASILGYREELMESLSIRSVWKVTRSHMMTI